MTTCLNAKLEEVRNAGKAFYAPSVVISGRTVVVTGKRIRMAQIKDEEVVESVIVAALEKFIYKLKQRKLKTDVFILRKGRRRLHQNMIITWRGRIGL